MTGGRSRSARFAAAAAVAAALWCAPAEAAPGDQQFTVIASHTPQGFVKALRAGADFVSGGRGRKFRIILASAGVIVAIPSTSIAQLEYMKMKRPAGLEIIACKETVQALEKANKRRLPTLPGISVRPCASIRNKMTLDGWQVMPGL